MTSLTNTLEVIAQAKDYQTKNDKFTKLKAEYDNIETQIESQLE